MQKSSSLVAEMSVLHFSRLAIQELIVIKAFKVHQANSDTFITVTDTILC